jgi:asparagine N-glycosylation enzyme membrane subunit Stt3
MVRKFFKEALIFFSMSYSEIKETALKVVLDKKYQTAFVLILFLLTLFVATNLRMQPITNGNLIDPTTGDYVSLALDTFYFSRHAEVLLENDWVYPGFDNFRSPHLNVTWHDEILPHSIVATYKIMHVFGSDATIAYASVLNPVIFFVLGLIAFFILVWILTRSKAVALVASIILSFIPPYLYRTLAGFCDHDTIGMFSFFVALLLFFVGMRYLEREKTSFISSSLLGLVAGFATMLTIASWGGIGKFLFMIFPLAFLINWFVKRDDDLLSYVLFYLSWFVGFVISVPIFGYPFVGTVTGNALSNAGILTLITLGYLIVDSLIIHYKLLNSELKKYQELISFAVVIVSGALFYQVFIGNVFDFILSVLTRILDPFKGGRLSQTVAEQKAPYLVELIGQVGKVIFYTFLAGCLIVGGKIAYGIKKKSFRPLFLGAFAFFVFGILYSRISSTSILNGDNFISKALFFVSFLVIAISSVYIYKKSAWKIDAKWIFIAAWMVPMLLGVRSAIRVFFAIVPFISMMVPLALFEMGKWARSKDELVRVVFMIATIALSLLLVFSLFGYYNLVNNQAKYQTPSYDSSWQNAMAWVRNNTDEGAVFAHWWDYGYWVQTGGDRPSYSDGGHSAGDYGDHIVGRYVLTTPDPNSAKSFLKSNNISYLLIDPTDIGKYAAFSSIGTGKDVDDRTAWIATLTSDPSNVQETKEGSVRMYQGGTILDDDLMYNDGTGNVFLPRGKAGIGAITIEKVNVLSEDNVSGVAYKQPTGIYIYNNKQYRWPIRYLYQGGILKDFGAGVNATVYLYPSVYSSSAGQQFDFDGGAIYLSERTKDSLVAKLYLMNDPLDEYLELELVYDAFDYPFPFYYQGFRGPIKIFRVNVDEMENILTHDEFRLPAADYGLLDDFEFVRA